MRPTQKSQEMKRKRADITEILDVAIPEVNPISIVLNIIKVNKNKVSVLS